MINLHDQSVNFTSKAHNERIKHVQMLCKFTSNKIYFVVCIEKNLREKSLMTVLIRVLKMIFFV